MREYIKEVCMMLILAILILLSFIRIVALKNVVEINKNLENEIEYLESRIEFYQNNEEWFEDFIEVLESTWQQKVEVEVLKERIYWLDKYKQDSEFNKEYADQMYDDLERYFIEIINYVEEHGNLIFFNDYFSTNYKEVYDRILNIYSKNH